MDRGVAGPLDSGRFERLAPLLALALFTAAIAVLHHELARYTYHDITRAARAVGAHEILRAVGLTALAYAVLAGYDAMALAYAGHSLPWRRTVFGSFVAYAFSQTLGFPLLTGSSVRLRLWSAWGLSSSEIARAVSFVAMSFTLGMALVGGLAFLIEPVSTARLIGFPEPALRIAGMAGVGLVAAYAGWALVRRSPIRIGPWMLPVPPPKLVAFQVTVPAADWTLAAAVLYVLLPPGHGLPFAAFLAIFLAAQFAGVVSHIPGGLGVVETLLVVLLRPYVEPAALLGTLLVYRGVYYLMPFAVAVVLLAAYELRPYGARAMELARIYGSWVPRLGPQILAGAVFLTGIVLLVSGATPAIAGRLHVLGRLFPLGVIELSHFAGSLAGAGLLIVAWGLWHRLDAAYALTVVLLGVGIVASLLKGGDWEEALVLGVVLAAVAPARKHFYRKSALAAEPLEPGWVVAIVMVVGATIWLGLFAHKHVEYQGDVWWRFTLRGDAPRFLRGTVGVVGMLLVLGRLRLLRHAPPVVVAPDAEQLARVEPLVAAAPESSAHLALVGDKALLFSDNGRGFLMYGVERRSWVALGDPVGERPEQEELVWRFRELADRHGGWTVFYQVGARHLPLYIDLGLTLLKVGEEARVPLTDFSLEGSHRKGLRRTQRTMEKEGVSFAVVPREEVPPLLPRLRAVSDAWLQAKHIREKGFSLGRFDERYIARGPVAVARRELSGDLMRYDAGAPAGVMEFLFIELMLWGRDQGFACFNLGMAPFAGIESRTLAPLPSRLSAFMYRHGEHFYHFRGLREYKEKFDPFWEPRYLASPGGIVLPRILANIAALVGGGLTGMLTK